MHVRNFLKGQSTRTATISLSGCRFLQRYAMAALKTQKKYNWKETNLAQFGSELEKQVRQVHLKLLKLIFVCVFVLVSRLLLLVILMYLIFASCVGFIFTDQEGKCGGRGCMEGGWDEGRAPSLEDCPV